MELRLLAHFCEDAALVEAFETGKDIHRSVAAQINGISLDEVLGEGEAKLVFFLRGASLRFLFLAFAVVRFSSVSLGADPSLAR